MTTEASTLDLPQKEGFSAWARNSLAGRCIKQAFATCAWSLNKPMLAQQPNRIVEDLELSGIAFASLADLGLPENTLEQLIEAGHTREKRHQALHFGADPSSSIFRKNFWYKLLGHDTVIVDKSDVFCRVALCPSMLDLVNQYLSCYAWLMDYNLWLNLATGETPKSSQMWHRDHVLLGRDGLYSPKIRRLIKVFIYLTDVDDKTGALTYLPGSHKGGALDKLEPEKAIVEDTLASRVADDVMERHVPRSQWIKAYGKAGTVVFFDASGYHKGGHIQEGKRLLFKLEYGSWMWMNPVYPKVVVRSVANICKTRAAQWAASIGKLIP